MPPARGLVTPNGPKVTQRRQELNFTQEDLAEKAGVAARTVGSIERGKPVLTDSLTRVATALGCQYADLALREDPPEVMPSPGPIKLRFTIDVDFRLVDEVMVRTLTQGIIHLATRCQAKVAMESIESSSVRIAVWVDREFAATVVAWVQWLWWKELTAEKGDDDDAMESFKYSVDSWIVHLATERAITQDFASELALLAERFPEEAPVVRGFIAHGISVLTNPALEPAAASTVRQD